MAVLSDDKVRDLELAEEKALALKFVEQARGNLTLAQWQKKENEYLQKIKMLESKIEDMRQQSKMRRGYEKYTGNMSGRG